MRCKQTCFHLISDLITYKWTLLIYKNIKYTPVFLLYSFPFITVSIYIYQYADCCVEELYDVDVDESVDVLVDVRQVTVATSQGPSDHKTDSNGSQVEEEKERIVLKYFLKISQIWLRAIHFSLNLNLKIWFFLYVYSWYSRYV